MSSGMGLRHSRGEEFTGSAGSGSAASDACVCVGRYGRADEEAKIFG